MLFPLNSTTPQSRIFETLNNELLHFLKESVKAKQFSEALFSQYQHNGQNIRSVCWSNEPTKEKFQALWQALPQGVLARQKLFTLVDGGQNIADYFSDLSIPIPVLTSTDLFKAFKSLTSHLFTQTKGLKSAKDQANCSLENHFQDFKRVNNNSLLCYLCGTAQLSQDRADLEDNEQWRADYDHVLCKDKYPIYSVHPGNFIPTCHICNSKAKGAKDVLRCSQGNRRLAFYPLPPSQESCYQYTCIEPHFRGLAELKAGNWQDPIASASITFPKAPTNISSKIDVWKEIYQVPSRVEAHVVTHFCERLASDLMSPQDFDDFCNQLARFTRTPPADLKKAEWRFWWQQVYLFLKLQDDEFLRDIWSLIEWKNSISNEADMGATFGIT